jgi:hypothetical protein
MSLQEVYRQGTDVLRYVHPGTVRHDTLAPARSAGGCVSAEPIRFSLQSCTPLTWQL